jgi:predicted HTH domain antitoxin
MAAGDQGSPASWRDAERRCTMPLTIPDEILDATRMTEGELRQEVTVLLFEKEKLPPAQASHLAGLDRLQFQHLLASRQIPVHDGVDGLERDLRGSADRDRGHRAGADT